MKKKILWVNEASFTSTGYATYGLEVLKRLHASHMYEIMELACYAPHGDSRAKGLPWKYISAMPNPSNPHEDEEYNRIPTNQFGEWKFEEACLAFKPDIVMDIRDWWMCLTAGTPILCYDGLKPVETIRTGDRVLTHKGKYRTVTHVFPRRTHSGTFVSLTPSYFRLPIELTEGHPVLAIKRTTVNLPDFKSTSPEWVNSEDLVKGDIVCLPRTQEVSGNLDTDLARLLGYYAAEGCIMWEGRRSEGKPKGVQFTLGTEEWAIILDIASLCERFFGKAPTVRKLSGSKAMVVRLFSREAANRIIDFIPGLAKTKRMNTEVFHSSADAARQFLCGLFRGDGHLRKDFKRANYCTSSQEMATQVFQLCVRLGVLPSVIKQRNNLKGKTFYRYLFSFSNDSLAGFVSIWNGSGAIPQSNRIDENFAYLTLDEVVHSTKEEEVYNFEVEEDNSYVSSFALHNCEFQERSPFRPYFNWAIMPTVDAVPQHPQWLSTFQSADAVFTYTDWAGDVLKKQCPSINYLGTASPGADLTTMYPVPDKRAHRRAMNIDEDCFIVGTVMRNQRRKLFPDLCNAFGQFLATAPTRIAQKTYLYMHTSWPDIGWDIPRLINEAGIGHRVLMTYRCNSCGVAFPSFFSDAKAACRNCGQYTATIPNSHIGVSREVLTGVMNLFDCYVQYANSEGFGMPMVEAAACGVPVFAVDYSAMSDVARKLEGYPVKVQRLAREAETHCWRALPDNEDFVQQLTTFLLMPEPMRRLKGYKARKAVEKHYDYEHTAKAWMDYFNSAPSRQNDWKSPPALHEPNLNVPEGLSDEEFVRWGICHIAGRPELLNSYMALRMSRDLNWGACLPSTGGIYFNDASTLGVIARQQEFDREIAAKEFLKMAEQKNYWEKRRVSRG